MFGMKKIMIFFCMISAGNISAQLVITPGAQLFISGSTQLTLQNTDLVNNGSFTAGTGTISFTGTAGSAISGSQPLQFYNLEINKTGASLLSLQKTIAVSQQINFTSGNIDLNGYNIDLSTTGLLNGEQETSHIIGPGGGRVLFSTVLNAPSAANPGNLGAIITSSQNLGNIVVGRGHQSQVNSAGGGNSILRYYDIAPVNNSSLDATLRFQYFDSELNGLTEGLLVFWNSPDNAHWTNQGFTTNNTTANYVEKTSIASFARWTLSSVNNALPVRFISFNTHCNGSSVLLTWKTAQEQNTHHYTIERSADRIQWTAVGNVPAAGNAIVENDYSYTDNLAIANSYYRLAEYDIDGKVQFTNVLHTSCSNPELFSVCPNPVSDLLYINISSSTSSNVIVKIFDGKGAVIKQQAEKMLPGNNLFSIDVKGIASGLYYTTIGNNNGLLKIQKIIKK